MEKKLSRDQTDYIFNILINKYRADPDRFCSYLPELTREIENNFIRIQRVHRARSPVQQPEGACSLGVRSLRRG